MKLIFSIFLLVILFGYVHAQIPQGHEYKNNFLLQIKILINNKSIHSTNITLSKQQSIQKTKFSYKLSSIHLKKYVTANVKLYAWYNADWIERNNINIKLTDKRSSYNQQNHLFSKLLKYKSRNFMNQMYSLNVDSILKSGKLYVSFDGQSSLLVSRLQYPYNFYEGANFVPLNQLNEYQTKQNVEINIQFDSVLRSDNFVDAKNFLTDLYTLQNKLKEMITLVTAPAPQQQIQPYRIYRNVLSNIQNLMRNTKKYKQKQALIKSVKLDNILIPYVQTRIQESTYYPILSLLMNTSLKSNDSLVSTFNYIVQQVNILDSIHAMKKASKDSDFQGKAFGIHINQLARYDILISYIVGAIWIIMDIINAFTKQTYVSSAFIFYLKRWLIFQIILQSIKIGSIGIYYHGIIFLVLIIIIQRLFTYLSTKRRKNHAFTYLDQIITQYTFNLIVLAIGANLILHLVYFKDIKGSQLFFWSFSQTKDLITEYYYFLVLIPSIMLTFKYKSTRHIGFIRFFLLLVISLKDNYWILLDEDPWIIFLHLKQQLIVYIVFMLMVIYGNKEIKIQFYQQVMAQKKEEITQQK